MKALLFIPACLICFTIAAQEAPTIDWDELQKTKPWEASEHYKDIPIVTASKDHTASSDAVVLFDGGDLNGWQKSKYDITAMMAQIDPIARSMQPGYTSEAASWNIEKGEMVVAPGTGAIATKQAFGDIQLHLEWNSPVASDKEGQQYSNSGVFFMGLYEVQILNSYQNPTYANGQAASVYKQHMPMVNASRPPGEWQVYDIVFMAPRFSEKGNLISPARVTVFHNGILTQNNVELLGPTCYIGTPYYVQHAEKLPLVLQDHGDPVRFRNIWVREL